MFNIIDYYVILHTFQIPSITDFRREILSPSTENITFKKEHITTRFQRSGLTSQALDLYMLCSPAVILFLTITTIDFQKKAGLHLFC